jgi:hypothetical protein
METKEEELSRCREQLEYWSKTENYYAIWYYTERLKELEGSQNEKCVSQVNEDPNGIESAEVAV